MHTSAACSLIIYHSLCRPFTIRCPPPPTQFYLQPSLNSRTHIHAHTQNLWAQSKMAWFVIFGLGVAVGFVAKSFTTPKSKERVKVVIKDKKK